MADLDRKGPTAGFRQAAKAFSQSTDALQGLGKDEAFWQLFKPLSGLPKSATFQAFASTQEWQVDLAQEEQTNSEEDGLKKQRSSFEKALTKRARQRDKLTVVPKEKREPFEKQQIEDKPEQSSKVFGTDKKRAQAENKSHPSSSSAQGKTAGAWSALERIENLTKELQPSEKGLSDSSQAKPADAKSFDATEQIQSQNKKPREKKLEALTSIQASKNKIIADAEDKTSSKRQPNQVKKQPLASKGETVQGDNGVTLLAQYVAKLWHSSEFTQRQNPQRGASQTGNASQQTAATQTPVSRQTTPAPRAPSLLTTNQQHPNTETAEIGTLPGTPKTQTSEARPPMIAKAERPAGRNQPTDEDLDERINRTLIEQAWLRGVDLT